MTNKLIYSSVDKAVGNQKQLMDSLETYQREGNPGTHTNQCQDGENSWPGKFDFCLQFGKELTKWV